LTVDGLRVIFSALHTPLFVSESRGFGAGRMIGDENERPKIFGALALVTGLGLTMVASVGVCGVLGYFVDRWLSTSPGFLISGILLGVVVGVLQAYRLIVKNLDK